MRSLVASDEVFDGFMRDWCQEHKFQSVTSAMMFDFFLSKFPDLVRATGAHHHHSAAACQLARQPHTVTVVLPG